MGADDAVMLGVRLSWAAVSDPGLKRAMNEDSVLAAPGIYAVADGMGGHTAGEVASSITVDRLRAAAAVGSVVPGTAVPEALSDAHQAIRTLAGDRVIGSTVTGLVLSEFAGRPNWLIWNVGDSRCYRVFQGGIAQITRDHTVVADLVESGAISPDDVARHPDRHVITRAIGTDDALPADYWLLEPASGERFVLCSDGLTNEVSDDEIADIIGSAGTPRRAAIGLLTLALERGGRDNVSAVVVFCDGVETRSGHSEAAPDETTTPRPAPPATPPANTLQRHPAESCKVAATTGRPAPPQRDPRGQPRSSAIIDEVPL